MFLNWLIGIVVLAMAVILVLSSAVVVPTVQKGIVTFFRKRGKGTGSVVNEGLRWVVPFAGGVEKISYELVTSEIAEDFFSKSSAGKGRLEVTIKGKAQWRPDKDDAVLRDVFLERSEQAISQGLVAQINAELGKVVGTQDAEELIENREFIDLLINAVLRLEKPFGKQELTPDQRFEYVKTHSRQLKKKLQEDQKRLQGDQRNISGSEERSEVERLYGIEIIKFSLADVAYSKETARTFELERQAIAKKDASQAILALEGQHRASGKNPREARTAAEIDMEKGTKRQVFSFEGLEGLKDALKGAVAVNVTVGETPKKVADSEKAGEGEAPPPKKD